MMHIKICGLTNLDDALSAVEAGADMLGFNFYTPSPRYISPETCKEIVQNLCKEYPERMRQVHLVGVFVNTRVEQICSVLDTCKLALAQLSGDETPPDVEVLAGKAFKVLRSTKHTSLVQYAQDFSVREMPPSFLVDAGSIGEYGGTGKTADWEQACLLARKFPILLAGGLTPANVAQAVYKVQPWGVDVASGVESAPGKKDHEKMQAFVKAAKSACEEIVRC